jgi:hypothetical protein
MTHSGGKRNLALIRKSGSTARILNLLVAHERFSATDNYQRAPMFRSKRLNRAIMIKHTLRGSEMDLFDGRRATGTKVIFPFAESDLSLGGSYFFASMRGGDEAMRTFIGDEVSAADMAYDEETLRALDALPSLDPFLLREGLRRRKREPALCYFDISEADIQRMTDYVSSEIGVLVKMAFQGGSTGSGDADALSAMMAKKLLSDENTDALMPLRATLQLSDSEYSEGIFAWKGFLYYKWVYADAQLTIARVAKEMTNLKFARADHQTQGHLNLSRERVAKQLLVFQSFVREALSTYDRSFRDLTVKARPQAFREFLLNSPAMFMEIGQKLGALMHVTSYWRFRFPKDALLRIEAEDALDLFQEFELSLDTGGAASRSQVKW